MNPVVHAITPGDHFSPRTGSAIPTVVHGLAGAATRAQDAEHTVLLDAATFQPRYPSAAIREYEGAPYPGRAARAVDAALGTLGLPRPSAARAFQPLADVMKGIERSIVLAHNAPALPRLLRAQEHDVVLYAHNDILRTIGHAEARRSLGDVRAIVCVSEFLADRTVARLPRDLAARVHVVANGVDIDTFHPAAQTTSGTRLRVMFVGRVVPEKGADILLKAASRLQRDDIEIVIVGSAGFDREAPLTAYESSLRDHAANVRGPVVFERFADRARVPELLRTADVFIVPSRWAEPSALTAGEALATGLPVIAARTGGIPDVIGDAGIIVPPDDPGSLAEALDHLASDSGERARLAASARARAESRTWGWAWGQLRSTLDRVSCP
ncbi:MULTISPECIES: glycosyltransferase family 4 protein [unclassified Microbacterium]|uniref:glycosyltransferase family 4 protein n=1 Tax=unclassified Microbacterium TaxID=2609290 RepID=UPI000C2CA838|nr:MULTISPECIES: glycosyltransferase family 4 protein [unclassified Microbacterium]